MKQLTRNDIWPLEKYERERDDVRKRMIALKSVRRIAVGEHLTLLFENRDTCWYQVQEMLRTERIFEDTGIQHEMETYNELIPTGEELSATLLVEYSEPADRDVALKNLLSLEQHIRVRVGDEEFSATFDDRQKDETRLSSVQFVKFSMPGITAAAWQKAAEAGACAIVMDHPYLATDGPTVVELEADAAASLREDLAV